MGSGLRPSDGMGGVEEVAIVPHVSSRAVEGTGDEEFGLEFVDSCSELGSAIGGVGVS